MWLPSPLATNTGSTPTERHARTGELTPPGMTCFARSKISAERDMRETLARAQLGRDRTGVGTFGRRARETTIDERAQLARQLRNVIRELLRCRRDAAGELFEDRRHGVWQLAGEQLERDHAEAEYVRA